MTTSAGAGAELGEARLVGEERQHAAAADQVILDRLDEARMRLRMLEGILGANHFAGIGVDVIMPLTGAFDAVSPMETAVEPLRAVRRGLLRRQHVAELVEESAGIALPGEIAAPPAPIGPGPGESVEYGARVALAMRGLLRPWVRRNITIGNRPP